MLKQTFLKTLYDKRWSTLIWALAIMLFTLFIVVLFPTFRESFGEALKDTPDSLKSLLGEASDYQHINGYIDIQVVNQMIFLTLIFGVILGTSLLGGEESDGRLQTLLTQPISRSRVYWHKFAAMSLLLFLAIFGVAVGTIIGALMIGELGAVSVLRVLEATFMTWVVTLVFAVLAFAVGACTGKKGMAGIASGFLAFTTFMITTLAGTAEVLKTINYISPFRYFNTPSIMKTGLETTNIIVLFSLIVVLAVTGWVVFRRRDVFPR